MTTKARKYIGLSKASERSTQVKGATQAQKYAPEMVARVRNGLLMGLLGYAEDLVYAEAPVWVQGCQLASMYMYKQGVLVTKATMFLG